MAKFTYTYTRREQDFLKRRWQIAYDGCRQNGYDEASSRRQASACVASHRDLMRAEKRRSGLGVRKLETN